MLLQQEMMKMAVVKL